jgi:hypothetical protein
MAARAATSWAGRILPPLVLFSVALVVYLHARFVESTDTVGNELLPVSVLQYHTLTFDHYYAGPLADGSYPIGDSALEPGSVPPEYAYRVAPEEPWKSVPWWFVRSRGHVISLYPITPGLLNVPASFVAQRLGLTIQDDVIALSQITASTVAALSVVCMYLCLVQVCARRNTAVFLSLLFAFGTAVWSANSRSLYQHGAAVFFITAALAALLTRRSRLVTLAGLALGLAVVTRPTNVLIAGGLALYVYRHERPAFPGFAALAVIPAVLLAWYSWAYWGSPVALGQGQGLGGFTAPEPAAAAVGLLLSPNRGLLVFSPILIFSVVYSVYLLRHPIDSFPLLGYLIWASVGMYALYTLWLDWAGGHTYGYRFLIEVVPGLMLVLAVCWDRVIASRVQLRALFAVAMLASVYVQGIGAIAAPCGFDMEPDNIDQHHERLWDVADGEIARCTRQEANALQASLQR